MSQPPLGRLRGVWVAVGVIVLVIAAVVVAVIVRSGNGTTSGRPSAARTSAVSPTVSTSAGSASSSGSVSPTAPSSSSPTAPSSSTSPASSAAPDPIRAQGFVALYPFRGVVDARAWARSYQQGGHQPWHLSATMTALSFAAFLRFTEIDRVTSHRVGADGAHIGVGYRNPAGAIRTAAVLHLMRYGTVSPAPWEVVGSDDTSFTFDRPSYGSHASSPLHVGGHITGVDENVNVAVYQLATEAPLGRTPHGVPAGGVVSPWSATVSYSGARPGSALTVVAWTGGHVQRVERFAVDGLYA